MIINKLLVKWAFVIQAIAILLFLHFAVPPAFATPCPAITPPTTPAELITAINTAQSVACPGAVTIDLQGQTFTFNAHTGYIALPSITTELTLENGIIERSIAGGTPEFRLLHNSSSGVLTLNNITLRNGFLHTDLGAAITNLGTLTLNNSTLNNNSAYRGGAVYNSSVGNLTIRNSTLHNNTGGLDGGAVYTLGQATIEGSTIRDNSATSVSAIGITGSPFSMANSTITGNHAINRNAIYISPSVGSATFTNVTIANNTAGNVTGGIETHANINLYNSILTNNTPTDCNVVSGGITFSPGATNIITNATTCGTAGVNYLAVDPQLGALTGSPAYFPLNPGSPAINAGDNASTGGATTDQAGNPRIHDGTVDLGSYETVFIPQTATVQFDSATSSAPEASGIGNILLVTTSDGQPTISTITLTIVVTGGTATSADYNLTGTITIPAGTAHNALVSIASGITVINENLVERNETLLLTISAPVNAVLGTQTTTTHTINNDDVATVTIDDVAQSEGNAGPSVMAFTVTVDNPVQNGFTLDYTTTNITALTADNDYVAITGQLIFAGTANESHQIEVTINGDTKVEANETFRVSFPSALGSVAPGSLIITDNAIGTIINDDNASVTITNVSQPENGTFTFTATLSNATANPFSVDWVLSAGSTSASDYVGGVLPVGGTLTFAGTIGETQTFMVPVFDDAVVESTEQFTISMSNFSAIGGFVVNITDTATGTITDNDSASVTIADVSQSEGSFIFTATLNNATANPFSVDWVLSAGTTSASDYVGDVLPTGGTLTFTGVPNQTRTFIVPVFNDAVVEPTEQFTISMTNFSTVGGFVVDISDTAIGTILDNDSASVTIANVSLVEGNTGTSLMTFTATLNNAVQGGFTVNYATSDGTATTSNNDYVATSGMLTFVGTAGETEIIYITINGDAVVEPNETFTVSMNTASNPAVNITDTATGTITNDDFAGYVVDTSATSASISEAGGITTFTIQLLSQPTGTVLLDFGSTDLTECTVSPTNFTFNAGNWNTSQTITINAVDDLIADGTQPCAVMIARNASSTATDYNGVADPANVTLDVMDNDIAGFTVSPTAVAISESGGTTTFTVTPNTGPTSGVIIPITTDGQCEINTTAIFSTSDNLAFGSGSTASQTVTVRAINDSVVEGAHTCIITTGDPVSFGDVVYNALGAGDVADVIANVIDNDVLHTLVAGAGGAEGTGVNPSYTFTITRAGALNVPSSINYTLGGTGVSGIDYVPLALTDITGANVTATGTTITFSPNASTATITITVIADSIAETDFTVEMTLSTPTADNGSGVGILTGSPASLTVTDDDVAGYIVDTSVTAPTIAEPAGTTTFTIRLVTQPTGTVILDFGSTDLSECSASPTAFTFDSTNWNTVQTITIHAVDDLIADGTQPCAITIARNASSTANEYNTVGDPANIMLNVMDDDTAGITISAPTSSSINELNGTTTATFTIVLNTQPTADVTLLLSSSNTSECTIAPSSITFTAGNWDILQTVTITAVDDLIVDGDQLCSALIGISTSADATYDGIASADVTLNVADNDTAGITISAPTNSSINELGGITTSTFTLVLDTQPVADVTLLLSSSDTSECTIAPSSVTFTTGNWNVPQTVTITSVDDLILDGDQPCSALIGISTSADINYDGIVSADVGITVIDNHSVIVPTATETLIPIVTAIPTETETAVSPTATMTPELIITPDGSMPDVGSFDPALSKVGVLLPGELGLLGERLEWEVTVFNAGTATGTNVIFTDTLRAELRIDDVQTSKGTLSINGQMAIVNIGDVAVGETIHITIITTVLKSNIAIDNTACVRSDTTDNECVTSNSLSGIQISQLPATGETPRWAGWLRAGLVAIICAGVFFVGVYWMRRPIIE